jgi:hypothetical protein
VGYARAGSIPAFGTIFYKRRILHQQGSPLSFVSPAAAAPQSLFRVARRLPWLQEKVCFLCLPPAFAAVPQYLFRGPSCTRPSQNRTSGFPTSGSSVVIQGSLRSTNRIQVSMRISREARPRAKASLNWPSVCLTLALAVEPFEQQLLHVIDIGLALSQVVPFFLNGQTPCHRKPLLRRA